MYQRLMDTDHWQGEIWNRRKDGTAYVELLNISAVRNQAGEISHYVGVSTDIQSLKDTQHRLEQLAHYDANKGLKTRFGVELKNRTGVNTGEVVTTDDPTRDQKMATGDAVNVTARLEASAPVNEILIGSFGLGNIIREGNIGKIVSLIEGGRGEGMQLMDDSILRRYENGEVLAETAYLFASQKQRFQHLLSKVDKG